MLLHIIYCLTGFSKFW